ncbi:NAD(P)/FAD-dependent oxidoreductase [Roseobacter sp. S98]|uniref:NAD(P)/FAD-dependent oxidoreductase n=1 Tax=Roseobacter algicola (ex Choi et al. 2025) (nom. illeg.) TaxID=3092138 RepID=UPI003F518A6D
MQIPDAFWRVTAPDAAPAHRLEGDLTVDVAVVGAGFTGLRTALELAEAGVTVAVFEAGDVGFGASGRNGGQVNPMLPVAQPDDLRKAVGTRYFERMTETALRSADDLFDFIRAYQIQCEARQKGWIRVDHCAAARDVARRNAALWNEHGADFEFMEREDVIRLTGAHGYATGTVSARGGAVQPMALVRGLDRVARAAGAQVFSWSPVRGMDRQDGRWHLQVNGHRVDAEKVVVATNGYSDGLIARLKGSVLPLMSSQMATGVLDEEQIGPILPQGHTISDTRRLIMYARREPGGQMLFGGIGFRRPLGGMGGFGWILKDAPETFPSLKGAVWKHFWGGHIALTEDRVPHLHEPAPGVVAGLGYNGRGVAMSHVMGQVLARRTLGTPLEALPFPVTGIPRYKFRLPQVLGAGMAMAVLRMRDQAEWRRND